METGIDDVSVTNLYFQKNWCRTSSYKQVHPDWVTAAWQRRKPSKFYCTGSPSDITVKGVKIKKKNNKKSVWIVKLPMQTNSCLGSLISKKMTRYQLGEKYQQSILRSRNCKPAAFVGSVFKDSSNLEAGKYFIIRKLTHIVSPGTHCQHLRSESYRLDLQDRYSCCIDHKTNCE